MDSIKVEWFMVIILKPEINFYVMYLFLVR